MFRPYSVQLVAHHFVLLPRLANSHFNKFYSRTMKSLPEIASERAGVPLGRAFAINNSNLYAKLGNDTFKKLSTEFYNRVYDDDEPVDIGDGQAPVPFKDVFKGFKKESAIRNQYEFVIQRLGGPALYSERKGHPALMRRHFKFPCTTATAERYMKHMRAALDAMPEIDEDSKQQLHDYFRHTSFFLAAGQESRLGGGSPCQHGQQAQCTA